MIKRIQSFIKLPARKKKMIFQTVGGSFYAWILFAFFKRLAAFGENVAVAKEPLAPNQKANDIAWAIRTVDQYMPWKNVCRHQAYQAKLLCNHYKIPCYIYIGFKKDELRNEIQAHAWTVAGGRIITGFCNPAEYIIQSVYKNKWA